jgi:hypothetical protein
VTEGGQRGQRDLGETGEGQRRDKDEREEDGGRGMDERGRRDRRRERKGDSPTTLIWLLFLARGERVTSVNTFREI